MQWNFFRRDVVNQATAKKKQRKSAVCRAAVGSVVESVEARLMFAVTPAVEALSLNVTTTADVVADDGQTSLREAIAYANTLTSGSVTFSPALTAGGPATITLNGTQLPIITKPVATGNLTIVGPGADKLTITGNLTSRIFEVSVGSGLTINKLTLKDGFTTIIGGAILNHGKLNVRDSVITHNSAVSGLGDGQGGAVFSDGSDLTLINDVITNNTADLAGGGIMIDGNCSTLISYCTIDGNFAGGFGLTAASGGGIENTSTTTVLITSSIISNNIANEGSGNGYGGGIENIGSSLYILDSTLTGNQGGNGGALDNFTGSTTLINNTITGNTIGLAVFGTPGIAVFGGSLNVSNSIVADKMTKSAGAIVGSNNLLVAGVSTDLLNGVNGNIVVADVAALKIGPLADNGGLTKTFALLAGSPALDAGNNLFATANGISLDQRDLPRIVNTTVDIGAFESQSAVVMPGVGPVVTTQPASVTVASGSVVSFFSDASGTPTPTVQWQFSTDGGATYNNLAGATSTTLGGITANASTNGYKYRAVFTNATSSATSNAATINLTVSGLTLTPNPVTFNPVFGQAYIGTVGGFSSSNPALTASDYSAQIDFGDTGGWFGNVIQVSPGVFNVTTGHGWPAPGTYNVTTTITGPGGVTTVILSTAVVVGAGNVAPTVLTNPSNQVVNAGQTATFIAAASGTPSPTAQWQVSTDGGATYNNLAGATNPTLTITNANIAQNGNRYRAVFTNSVSTATTTGAMLTVNAAALVLTPVPKTFNPVFGQPYVSTVGGFTSSDSSLGVGAYAAFIDYGDTGGWYGNITQTSPGVFNVTGGHGWPAVGTYNVNTTITGPGGLQIVIHSTAIVV